MKPEDIKNKEIAVLCDTIEKAKMFCCMCGCIYSNDSIKCRVSSFGSLLCQTYMQKPNVENWVEYASRRHYEQYGYIIITFDEFLTGEMRDIQLSAVEVLEVLVNEYKGRKYDEIFGCDPCFVVLISRFTPTEIVQKVTEWKRKQDNKTKITEDMIADALDEKYGIGNWGRE